MSHRRSDNITRAKRRISLRHLDISGDEVYVLDDGSVLRISDDFSLRCGVCNNSLDGVTPVSPDVYRCPVCGRLSLIFVD
jgi:hypothetical protein